MDGYRAAISPQDPAIPLHYRIQYEKGKERKKLGLDSRKKRKKAMDGKDKERMMELEASIRSAYGFNIIPSPLAEESGPAKKRRRCADSKIVQSSDLSLDSGRSSRSKSKANS